MAEHYIEAAGIGAYVCALREAERSGATIEKYARELRRFGVWLGGRAVTKETVIEYKAVLTQRYAPASVNCMLAALNGYFSYCGWGECRVKPLRIQRALYRDAGREMSRAEYARLVAAAAGPSGTSAWRWCSRPCAAWGCGSASCGFLPCAPARQGAGGDPQQRQMPPAVFAAGTLRAAACLLPGAGHRRGAGFCDTQRAAAGPLQHLAHDEGAVPGGKGRAAEGVPAQPAASVCTVFLQAAERHRAPGLHFGPQQHQHDPRLHPHQRRGVLPADGKAGAAVIAAPFT